MRLTGYTRTAVIAVAIVLLAVVATAVVVWLARHEGHDEAHAQDAEGAVVEPATYIDLMIPHHEMAVEMAREVMRTTGRADVRGMADDIISAQTWEIARMRRIRAARYADVPEVTPTPQQRAAMGMAHDHGAAAGSRDGDVAFVEAMIPHHAGAIVLSRRLLLGRPPADLARLARAVIAGQALEIGRMEAYRQQWASGAGDPDPPPAPTTTAGAPVTP